jgi:ribosomal protein L29
MADTDLRGLSDEALVHFELATERELAALSLRHRMGNLEDTSRLGKLRKAVARAKTIQSERELAGGLERGSLRRSHRASFSATIQGGGQQEAAGFLKGVADRLGLDEGQV